MEKQNTYTLSIVFSFKNEEEVLPELVTRVHKVMEKIGAEDEAFKGYEMIFVNDASTDNSFQLLTELQASYPAIRIVNMSRTFGVSPCVMAGFKHSSGDGVVYMDADLQDPPELIETMVRTWRESGVDVVNTQRTRRAGETFIKLMLTRLGYAILNSCSQVEIQQNVGDFKLLSRRAVDHLIELKEVNPFMRGLVSWIGFPQIVIPYERDARAAGETKFPIFSLGVIKNFLESALISFSSVPLKIATVAGVLGFCLSACALAYVLIEKALGHNLPGWTAVMVSILFLSSIQLLCLGMLGLYMHSAYLESKKRPNYIVQSLHGFNEKAGVSPATDAPDNAAGADRSQSEK